MNRKRAHKIWRLPPGLVRKRERKDEALRRSEARNRALLEALPDLMFVMDADGRYLDYKAPRALLAAPPEIFIGHTVMEILPPEVGQLFQDVIQKTLQRGQVHEFEYQLRLPADGLEHQFEARMSLSGADQVLVIVRDITERKQAEDALRQSRHQLEIILQGVADSIVVQDADGNLIYLNDAAARLVGAPSVQDMTGDAAFQFLARCEILDENGQTLAWERLPSRLAFRGLTASDQILRWRISGSQDEHWMVMKSTPILDESGRVQFVVSILNDITDRKRSEEALRQSEQRYRSLFERIPVGIYRTTTEGQIVDANPALVQMLGFPDLESLLEVNAVNLFLRSDDRDRQQNLLEHEGVMRHYEMQMRRRDHQIIWVRDTARAVRSSNGEVRYFEGSLEDITERKRIEAQLIHDAFHDTLTGLPNRALFTDRLERAIERSYRNPDQNFAVLFLDIDRFKVINDSMGHPVGDQLLVAVSRRLESCLRSLDTVARLGGDEFVILLEDLEGIQDVSLIAGRILDMVKRPFHLEEYEVYVTTSIGVVRNSPEYRNAEEMLRDADIAMYRAKSQGKARFVLFDGAMHEQVVRHLKVENELRRALKNQELEVQYEPIVSLDSGKVMGFEALVRWRHPERGLVYPKDFIPIAEETGLIIPIDRYVLAIACREMRGWHERFPNREPLTLSVNLSSLQFSQPDFVADVHEILESSGFAPQYLRLEITESVIMENAESVNKVLEQLRDLGVQVHVDDFGTGYSSLNYLYRLPIDAVKIDHSFISGIEKENNGFEIVRTIVRLAHDMGIDAIAEGVETDLRMAKLKEIGCEFGQGYLFSRSLDSRSTERLLEACARRGGTIFGSNGVGRVGTETDSPTL